MDSVHVSLPWPSESLAPGRWQPSVVLASAQTSTDFMDMNGSVVTVALARGVNARWGYQLMATYGAFEISGGDGRAPLTQKFLGTVPLDLPQSADFTATRGTQRHLALGGAAVHGLSGGDAARSAQLVTGLLVERVRVTDFAMNYRLVDGAMPALPALFSTMAGRPTSRPSSRGSKHARSRRTGLGCRARCSSCRYRLTSSTPGLRAPISICRPPRMARPWK